MESLTFHLRRGDEETIESWDDDGDLQCYEDIQLRTASSATSVTNSSIRRSGHRDSISSRRSARSDLDSTAGDDEDWQVQLLDNEEAVNEEAIASAKSAGIPLPANVPKSALVGGTIKRLGPRKTKHKFVDDWSDDVEFPDPDAVLELKSPQAVSFPESLQQISSVAASPVKTSASPFWSDDIALRLQSSSMAHMDMYREDDAGDVDDIPTIKPAKLRSPQRASVLNKTMSDKESNMADAPEENFEEDFDLPPDNSIRLSPLKATAETQSPSPEDFDMEWSEGSIGVRVGGTARDHRSNPSSSISVVSPSASSCLTAESEDEGLDGLVIPEGPLDLTMSMQKRLGPHTAAVETLESKQASQDTTDQDDFFSGLELEGGDIFDTKKLSINPNIKCKADPGSPARRSATTLTFTNTTVSPKTRIPRLSNHDRQHSTHLETVSESGAPLSKFRTSLPKTSGHTSHSSMSGISSHGTSLTSPNSLSPGRRFIVGARLSRDSANSERTITGHQLLKTKRSLPTIRNSSPTASTPPLQSPRQDLTGCPFSSNSRSKTPVDRVGHEARSLLGRRLQTPFIPAGASEHQSHHASVKSSRHTRRANSDSSQEAVPPQGPVSRLPRPGRYEALGHNASDSGTQVTAAKRTLTRPTRRRNFGDGTELASFDDLPTSSTAESKFVKHPSGRGAPRSLKNKLGRSQTIPSRTDVQQPVLGTPTRRYDQTPRFARDTNASRNAREQRIASMSSGSKSRENSALVSLSSNWNTQTISRVPTTPLSIQSKKNRTATISGSKPHLIKPLGTGVQERKSVNGMRYNPATFRWEGNESLAQDFDTDSPQSPKPAPALITNVGAMQNVQVVGGMVFDPQRMCWLKLAPLQPGTKGLVAVQDEDDVFAGLGNLEEKPGSMPPPSGVNDDLGLVVSGDDRSCGDSSDEWPITEEFDVGPEFIRRQRAEEEKWRRKVNRWTDFDRMKFGDSWRWAIRDLVGFNSTLSVQGLGGN
ncbi:putative cytokinesis regulator (Byr4) [Aspergillus affinis]|uniref:putative cytokinesis regulator (Byr4) n=1 Tax=Aspergillus affinis TaxID=1070780 RepID=UPI0022FDCDC8|nr:cytokinesis regulator [Aspergillus affinis]KAI9041719.1 cytokinesis regulator [Aspergillus affinis]